MSYHVRAFCRSDILPPLSAVVEWAAQHDVRVTAEIDPDGVVDGYVRYDSEKQPLIVEIDTGELLREEIEELVEALADVDESPEKERVLGHVRNSQAVVAVQLLSDVDDQGYAALAAVLSYYVENCGGLVHAQDEGFYEGDRIILELA